jgi:menaquinone-dependent protoporphyrinogen oxidase
MKVLIAYATIEGQTEKIARFVGDEVSKAGHDFDRVEISQEGGSVPLDDVDSVVLAAPVHERRHPKAFEAFVAGQRDVLGTKRTLLLSVSLRAAFEQGLEEAQDYVDEFKLRTGFSPEQEALVAGAVRSESYDYYQTEIMRHVLLRDQEYDVADGAREFTDWSKVSATLRDFLARSDGAPHAQ